MLLEINECQSLPPDYERRRRSCGAPCECGRWFASAAHERGDRASAAPLGVTTEHSKAIREIRKKEFSSAIETGNKELVAITYGDGEDLTLEGVTTPQEQIQYARKVADALREVLEVLRQEINGPDAAAT